MQSINPTMRYYIEQNDVYMACGAIIDGEFQASQIYVYEAAQGWIITKKAPETFDDSFLANEELTAKAILLIEKSYKEQLQMAKDVAQACHAGQKDKAGKDYYESHLCYVGERCPDGKTKIVGYLHDILEDTDMQPEILLNMGFGMECINAIKILTRAKGIPYMEYIAQIKKNPLAKQVKLIDLAHNMDISRISNPTKEDEKRIKKYVKAYVLLNQ